MNEGTTCCVCFCDYDELNCLPVVATCGHTVCKNCSSSLRKLTQSSVNCPTCRGVVTIPMPPNFSFISLLSSMRQTRGGMSHSASSHLTSTSIQFSVEEIQNSFANSILLSKNLSFQTSQCYLRGRYVTITCLSATDKYLLGSEKEINAFEIMFKNQCALLSELIHPNIIKFFGHSISKNPLECAIVSEYLPGGTLYDRLFPSENKESKESQFQSQSQSQHHQSLFLLQSSQRISLAIDIAKAIAYQHGILTTDWSIEEVMEMKTNLSQYEADTQNNNQTGVQITYHKDIRSMNVLLSADLTGKLRYTLIDQSFDELVSEGETEVTNREYAAPEALRGEYVIQSEIFSFGVILFELLCSQPAIKLMPMISQQAQALDSLAFSDFIQATFFDTLTLIDWKPAEVAKLCKIGQDCILPDIKSRPSSMRIVLLALLQLQYEMVGYTSALESGENHLQLFNIASNTTNLSPSLSDSIAQQTPTIIRYHTGHYRRYYGGPTNGRWSCCESYERDAEGCQSGLQARHHPDRNKLWGEGYNWNCCSQPRSADGCVIGPQLDPFLLPSSTPTIPQSPPPLPAPSQTTSTRYHTGHYRRYYGGPTNGRWSCCESYDRDAEGCQNGPQIRHHPDRNKLWGEGYNWNCCGRERTSDGCKAGPQPGQLLVELSSSTTTRVASPQESRPSPRPNPTTTPETSRSPTNRLIRYHTGHYRRYYGGPTNGRWSCCESYERDAEGCQSGLQARHHPDRNKLWGEGYNWNCCSQPRSADGCTIGLPADQFMAVIPTNTPPTPRTPPLSPRGGSQTPAAPANVRYHTGHYKPYYGGPTNGRWSCCESYDRDVEGCQSGPQIRHHPDCNKLWGEGYNWNCCGRERTSDGCKAGAQVGQYLIDPPVVDLISYHPGNYRSYVGGPSPGRWSCCENFNKEAEGCHRGPFPKHHSDLNKLWGTQYTWSCCGQPRSADGCISGPHPHPIHPDTRTRISPKPSSRTRAGTRTTTATRRIVPSPDQNRSSTRLTSSSSTPSASVTPPPTLQALLSMGFSEREAQEAVARTSTLEQAIDFLTNR